MASRRQRLSPVRRLAPYEPHPHQTTFHRDPHKYRALVSGVGAGKTRMGVEEVLKWSQLYPGSLGIIGRLTAKSLKETTQRRFFEVCDPKLIEAYNQSDGHLWLKTNSVEPDGSPVFSEILFMHFDDPGPLGSLDISYFWIDEAHEPDGKEVPVATFDMLTARLRHPIGPWRGFITSNSGGKDWVWDKFFNPNNRARLREYIGWVVPTTANAKYLPEGYVEELTRTHTEVWVNRFLNASFDAFEGQIFTDFQEDFHTYDPVNVDISPYWERAAGFDFGVSAPTAALYGSVDQDGILYITGETYRPEADIGQFAQEVRRNGFTYVYADPSVVNRGPNKKSPKDLYGEVGLTLIPSPNSEDFFITYLVKLFRGRTASGGPLIMISNRCVNLIEQIKQSAWDPSTITGTTHDRVKLSENHARDALKYLLNALFMPGKRQDPIVPKAGHVSKSLTVNGSWEHNSFADDLDIDSEDYPFLAIKEAVKGVD